MENLGAGFQIVPISREVTVPACEAHTEVQEIVRIAVHVGAAVEVSLRQRGETGIRMFQIKIPEHRDYYTELMSANPVWAPLKPAGTFRPEDLFALMDYIDSGQFDEDYPVP